MQHVDNVGVLSGYVAFFSTTHPDDESASSADAKAKAEAEAQHGTIAAGTIAAPETMTAGTNTRNNLPATPGQLVARSASSGVSTVNVPPTVRSLPTRLTDRSTVDSSSVQTAADVALLETIAIDQSNPDALDQNRSTVGATQSLPFASVTIPLSDVKGTGQKATLSHWLQKALYEASATAAFVLMRW